MTRGQARRYRRQLRRAMRRASVVPDGIFVAPGETITIYRINRKG